MRRCAVMICTAVMAMTFARWSAAATEVTEDTIKAAFLYKFGFFVEWPNGTFATADSPINVCVVNDDAFSKTLEQTVAGQKIGEHSVTVKRVATVSRDSGCNEAYLPSSVPGQGAMLAGLKNSSVLTVTDAANGVDSQGIINFVIKDSRVRFDIDDAAAALGGLNISSRLLNLAVQVKPRH